MNIGFLDWVLIVYVGWGIRRGYRQGLPEELPKLVGILVFLVTGWGLFRWMNHALAEANQILSKLTGGVSFLGLLAGAFLLARHFRGRLRQAATERFGEQKKAAAVVGGMRAFFVASVLILVLAHWPLRFLTRPLAEASLLGRGLTRYVLPVYEKTHNGAL